VRDEFSDSDLFPLFASFLVGIILSCHFRISNEQQSHFYWLDGRFDGRRGFLSAIGGIDRPGGTFVARSRHYQTRTFSKADAHGDWLAVVFAAETWALCLASATWVSSTSGTTLLSSL
jgi:hypothetical protein